MASDPDPDKSQDNAYYRRLQVGPAASHDEIVRAYRRLALGVHPDAHPEDPEATRRFREVTEAYEVLAHPARRAAYDRSGPRRRIPVQHPGPTEHGAAGNATPQPAATPDQLPPTPRAPAGMRPARGLPLRVGPVRVADPAGTDDPTSARRAIVFEVLEPWWWR